MTTLAAHQSTDWKQASPAYLAGAAAATSLVSIAASQILLGMAIVALMMEPQRIRWPRAGWPLLAFTAWTLVSWVASPDMAAGMPQIKKIYVYLMLWVVYSGIRSLKEIQWIAAGWAVGGSLSAMWGLVQYVLKFRETPEFFYFVYSNNRITGFMDHWMTFGGTMILAMTMTGAIALFGPDRDLPLNWPKSKWTKWMAVACGITAFGLLLDYSRSMWLGGVAAALWLLWAKRPWLMALVPVGIVLMLALNPFSVRDRLVDMVQPQVGAMDTTTHRLVLLGVGWEMVKAHPLLGVGPEQVGPQLTNYLPDWVEPPLPEHWYTAHLHNTFVHYAAERGVPALLAILWLLGQALWDFGRAVRRAPANSSAKWVLHGAIACVIGMIFSGLGEVNLGDSEVLGTFLGILACGYVAVELVVAEQRDTAQLGGTQPAQN